LVTTMEPERKVEQPRRLTVDLAEIGAGVGPEREVRQTAMGPLWAYRNAEGALAVEMTVRTVGGLVTFAIQGEAPAPVITFDHGQTESAGGGVNLNDADIREWPGIDPPGEHKAGEEPAAVQAPPAKPPTKKAPAKRKPARKSTSKKR